MYGYKKNSNGSVSIDNSNELLYAAHVYDPENTPPTRIPSMFPINTALFHSDRVDTVGTGANNSVCISVTMNELYNNNRDAVAYYDAWSTTGGTSGQTSTNLSPTRLTVTDGHACRLVAYKIKLRYIGTELDKSGFFFACHDFNYDNKANTGALAQFQPNLSTMQDCPVFEIQSVDDGIECIFKPYDNSYLEFTKANVANEDVPDPVNIAGTFVTWRPYVIHIGYASGKLNTSGNVLVEQYLTVEYIPAPANQDLVEMKKCQGNAKGVVATIKARDTVRPCETFAKASDQKGSVLYEVANGISKVAETIANVQYPALAPVIGAMSSGVRTLLS